MTDTAPPQTRCDGEERWCKGYDDCPFPQITGECINRPGCIIWRAFHRNGNLEALSATIDHLRWLWRSPLGKPLLLVAGGMLLTPGGKTVIDIIRQAIGG